MNRSLVTRLALVACFVCVLAACTGVGTKTDVLNATLYGYVSAIRWNEGNVDDALTFVKPEYLAKHPLSQLERDRFSQFQVSGYYPKGSQQISETLYGQRVEIRLINVHTQAERSIIDDQIWEWDAAAERWWLTTGLPKLAEAR